jgi:hypothetical protein
MKAPRKGAFPPPGTGDTNIIALINASTLLTDPLRVAACAAALEIQVNRDLAPAWSVRPTQVIATDPASPPPPSFAWQLVLLDDADQAGALGYHLLTPFGLPLGRVFVRTAQQAGVSWQSVASHELCEMLVDPWINLEMQTGAQQFMAVEVCDPVEGDSYLINSEPVSNFVTPPWFVGRLPPPAPQRPFDQLALVTAMQQLRPQGYVSVWDPVNGWQAQLGPARTAVPDHDDRIQQRLKKGIATRKRGHIITLGS